MSMKIFDISANYMKLENNWCANREPRVYYSLFEAKEACSLDNDCSLIYDHSCDGPPYSLCGSIALHSSDRSCLYLKPEEKGNFLSVFFSK